MKINNLVYRVRYRELDKINTMYVRYISEESLVGFLEADELILGNDAEISNDELTDEFCAEFKGVQRVYLPLHVILRIDEIDLGLHQSTADAKNLAKGNVSRFPSDSTAK